MYINIFIDQEFILCQQGFSNVEVRKVLKTLKLYFFIFSGVQRQFRLCSIEKCTENLSDSKCEKYQNELGTISEAMSNRSQTSVGGP